MAGSEMNEEITNGTEETEETHQNYEQNNSDHNNCESLIIEEPDGELESMVQQASEEYTDLNNTLDQLDTWMNNLEQQNDSLYSKLQDLLESNRQTRLEIQQENAKTGDIHSSHQDKDDVPQH